MNSMFDEVLTDFPSIKKLFALYGISLLIFIIGFCIIYHYSSYEILLIKRYMNFMRMSCLLSIIINVTLVFMLVEVYFFNYPSILRNPLRPLISALFGITGFINNAHPLVRIIFALIQITVNILSTVSLVNLDAQISCAASSMCPPNPMLPISKLRVFRIVDYAIATSSLWCILLVSGLCILLGFIKNRYPARSISTSSVSNDFSLINFNNETIKSGSREESKKKYNNFKKTGTDFNQIRHRNLMKPDIHKAIAASKMKSRLVKTLSPTNSYVG